MIARLCKTSGSTVAAFASADLSSCQWLIRPNFTRRETTKTRCTSSSSSALSDKTDHAQQPQQSSSPRENLQSLFKNPIVHKLWTERQAAKAREGRIGNVDYDPSVGKAPADSRVEITYAFSTDELLYESYRNPWGQMRLGRMMEDLDALAGNIAFFHVDQGQTMHPIIVTASVDRIRLQERPTAKHDQILSGQVSWTGKSSMEIRMSCMDAGTQQEWLEAFVTFVTLDPITKKPTAIPPILPQTPDEESYFTRGAQRAALKRQRRSRINSKPTSQSAPSADHTAQAHIEHMAASLLQEAGPLLNMPALANPHSILMNATRMQNAMIAQPQTQNLHNRVFGGFLMRRAFELAYSNAYVFGGARPIFLEVDDVSFANPVDVGDLLVFNSRVLYTDHGRLGDYYASSNDHRELPLIHVEVEAWVTEPERVSARLSNQFYFTFAADQPMVRRVLPSSMDEASRMATRMEADRQQQYETR